MRILGLSALLLAGLALAGCTAQASAVQPSTPAAAPASATGQGTVDPAKLALSYHVEGGGEFVQGSRDMCDLLEGDSIEIEDQKSVDNYTGSTSVTSMVLSDGQVGYATSWPTEAIGTGVTDGTGQYVVNADASGDPISFTGTALVIWHDASTGKSTKRPDTISFKLTPIPRPDYCPAPNS